MTILKLPAHAHACARASPRCCQSVHIDCRPAAACTRLQQDMEEHTPRIAAHPPLCRQDSACLVDEDNRRLLAASRREQRVPVILPSPVLQVTRAQGMLCSQQSVNLGNLMTARGRETCRC